MSPRRLTPYFALLAAFVLARPAAAAGGGDAATTFLGLPIWVWALANLVIFVGVLWYLIAPPISRFLDTRRQEIEANLAEAEERRSEVTNMNATVEAKLAELEAHRARLVDKSKADAQAERNEILAQAEREKVRLLDQAKAEIAHRLTQAKAELKDHATALAADLARQQLESELTADDRRRLFSENVERLEEKEAS